MLRHMTRLAPSPWRTTCGSPLAVYDERCTSIVQQLVWSTGYIGCIRLVSTGGTVK
jgi:hypothetical protein